MERNYTTQPSLLRKYFDHLQNKQLDIHKLVCSGRNLLILAKPIIGIAELCQKISRWECFWTTAAILLICNIWCILLPSWCSAFSVCMVLLMLFGLGFGHQKYRILVKAFPTTSILDSDEDKLEHHECMQEFHLLLIIVDELMLRISYFLLKLYSVLKLEDWNFSLKCYAAVLFPVFILFHLPLRIFVALLVDLVIIYQPVKEWLLTMHPSWFEPNARISTITDEFMSENLEISSTAQPDDAHSQSSDVQADPGFGTDSEGSEKLPSESSSDEMPEVSSIAGDVAFAQKTDNKPETSSKTPGVVGRLLELKKRQVAVKERCTGCGVLFTTILKRRHICNHCGNYFCSRCCSHKVPRATFGATAPAAQTETVAVCLACYCVLTGTLKRQS